MIHDLIINRIVETLERELVDDISIFDPSRAFLVKAGWLQGDPDPDEARIFITVHENDPHNFIAGGLTGMEGDWSDVIDFAEVGLGDGRPVTTWRRRFTIRCRLLLEQTGESESQARELASTLRTRIEQILPTISFSGISASGEYVSMPITNDEIKSEMLAAGGPPDSYDYHIKIRFSLQTTMGAG